MSKAPFVFITDQERSKLTEIAELMENSPEPDRGLNLRNFLKNKKTTSREINELLGTCNKLWIMKNGCYSIQKWTIPLVLLFLYIVLSFILTLTWKTFIVYAVLLVVALFFQFRLWYENKDILNTIEWIQKHLREFLEELVVSEEND